MDHATRTKVESLIAAAGGMLEPAINWTWATFDDDKAGRECFALVEPFVEHRGYYDAQPDSTNENLRRGGFRFR